MELSPKDKVEGIRMVLTILNQLTSQGALAGIILTDETFGQFKSLLRSVAKPYAPAELSLDPSMEHTFVVDGLLVLRGTMLGETDPHD